jgi:hypothetical protein
MCVTHLADSTRTVLNYTPLYRGHAGMPPVALAQGPNVSTALSDDGRAVVQSGNRFRYVIGIRGRPSTAIGCGNRFTVQVQVCFTSVCGQVQPLDVALSNSV